MLQSTANFPRVPLESCNPALASGPELEKGGEIALRFLAAFLYLCPPLSPSKIASTRR